MGKSVKFGDYTVQAQALRNAEWGEAEVTKRGTWDCDYYGGIITIAAGDYCAFRSLSANVPAVDADGTSCSVNIELTRTENEDADIRVDGDIVAAEIDGWPCSLSDIEDIIGFTISEDWSYDIDEVADDFIADHEGCIYVMDNERGFANEWTLYVCKSQAEAEKVEASRGHTERIAPDSVRRYIIDALMSAESYRRKYGLEHCVELRYA